MAYTRWGNGCNWYIYDGTDGMTWFHHAQATFYVETDDTPDLKSMSAEELKKLALKYDKDFKKVSLEDFRELKQYLDRYF